MSTLLCDRLEAAARSQRAWGEEIARLCEAPADHLSDLFDASPGSDSRHGLLMLCNECAEFEPLTHLAILLERFAYMLHPLKLDEKLPEEAREGHDRLTRLDGAWADLRAASGPLRDWGSPQSEPLRLETTLSALAKSKVLVGSAQCAVADWVKSLLRDRSRLDGLSANASTQLERLSARAVDVRRHGSELRRLVND